MLSRIFDPCGLVGPFVLQAKMLFQSIWQLGLSWDEVLPEELAKEFQKWLESTSNLRKLNITKQYFPELNGAPVRKLWNYMHLEMLVNGRMVRVYTYVSRWFKDIK